MITNNKWLVTGGTASFLIAMAHIVAIFIGAPAYDFMDAPDLGRLAREGSFIPVFATLAVTSFFVLFGAYAFSGAGIIKRLPFLRIWLWVIGGIFTLRGLAIFYFIALFLMGSPNAIPREILFSLVSLLTGICYLLGVFVFNSSEPKRD